MTSLYLTTRQIFGLLGFSLALNAPAFAVIIWAGNVGLDRLRAVIVPAVTYVGVVGVVLMIASIILSILNTEPARGRETP